MDESPLKKRRTVKFREITQDLSKEELIRRLQSASVELRRVDQGECLEDIEGLAASLANYFIFYHKEKDVRSYSACCLVDVLRIFTPEPPYNADQLKDIFRLLLNQLKELQTVHEGASFKRCFHVLETLSLGNTFTVCLELEAMDIVIELFQTFYQIVNSSNSKNLRVKSFLLDIMCSLIQEGNSLPEEILELMLKSLVEPNKTKKPGDFQLSCDIIDRCSSALEPYMQLFFNNALVLGNIQDVLLEEKIYDLLFELYKISKNVLFSVLPQLDCRIKGTDEEGRLESLKLLRKVFEHDDTYVAEDNKVLWQFYLGRFVDVSCDIRIECVHISKRFLTSSTEAMLSDVTEQLYQRFLDPDEKVRLETVVIVCQVAETHFSRISKKLLDAVRERTRDKKWLIRREAVTCIGKLYKRIYNGSNGSNGDKSSLSWVPACILPLYMQNSIDDRLCIERVIHGCLVPVSMETEQRMKRLLNVYTNLEETTMNIFDGMMKHRYQVTKDFRDLLLLFRNNEVDNKEKKLYSKTFAVAKALPDSVRAQEYVKRLIQLCVDDKLYKLLLLCTDGSQECVKIIKAVTEILKKVSPKNVIIDTVKSLLDRACPMLVDIPSLTFLLKEIKNLSEGINNDNDIEKDESEDDLLHRAKCGLKLVKCLASVQPGVFQSTQCYEALLLFVKHDAPTIVEYSLEALYHVIDKLEETDKPLSSCYQPVLSKLVTQGTQKQSKLALRCLHIMLNDSSLVMERLFKNLIECLHFNGGHGKLQTVLAACGEMARLQAHVFEKQQSSVIREFVVKQLLNNDREDTSESQESMDEWLTETQVSQETHEKIAGMKLLTRWLIGLKEDHANQALPVFRLLTAMINRDGDLTGKGKVSAVNRSRLRLRAALSLLKLVQNINYVDVITIEQYQQLSLVIQDSCFEVREKFTMNLHKALDKLQLPLDYFAFFALVAADPARERKIKVRQMITKNAQTRRGYSKLSSSAAARPYNILPEYTLPYIVHLLAHHPDFLHTDTESLVKSKEYLWFFLEPIMGQKAENFSFLKKLLENIKQTKDCQDPDNSIANEKLYAVCDLAVQCIMTKCQTITLKEFPGKVVLPRKLFQMDVKLDSTKSYLPKGFVLSPKKVKPSVVETKPTQVKQKKEKVEVSTATKRPLPASRIESESENQSPNKKKTKVPGNAVKKISRGIPRRGVKSPIKKFNTRSSPAKTSPTKKTKTTRKSPAKQTKIDSFVTKTRDERLSEETSTSSPLKQYPLRSSSPRKNSTLSSPDVQPMSEEAPPLRNMGNGFSQSSDDVPSPIVPDNEEPKLMVRRKQRTRR